MDRRFQRESAVALALALRHEFTINRSMLESIKVFKYLGCLFAQDDNDAQAI